jgi:hypothetical protein
MTEKASDSDFSPSTHTRLKRWAYIASTTLLIFAVTGSDLTGSGKIAGMDIRIGAGYSVRDGLILLVMLINLRMLLTWPALPLSTRRKKFEIFDHSFAVFLSGIAIWIGVDAHLESGWPKGLAVFGLVAWTIAILWAYDLPTLTRFFIERDIWNPWVKSDDEVRYLATLTPYTFYYCPDDPDMKKVISFSDKGEIVIGSNDNENTWSAEQGRLIIYNKSGAIYSRFRFHRSSLTWQNTNDRGTPSLRNQFMIAGEPTTSAAARAKVLSDASAVVNAADDVNAGDQAARPADANG